MPETPTPDQLFIQKLTEIIRTNLDNEAFGVTELVHESGMSHYHIKKRLYAINGKKRINLSFPDF